MLRASAAIEKAGIPTVSIVSSEFMKQAAVITRGLGVPLAIAEYPGAPMVDGAEALRKKIENDLLPALIRGMTRSAAAAEVGPEPAPGAIAFSGTLDEVEEHFHRQMWSDGLPVIPPTRESVQAFLEFTDRAPDEVLGVLPIEGREATILNSAVNGVMAGCRPEYMPLLVAVVEAMCDPYFKIEEGPSTTGWEPLVIVSGPVAKQLGFNCGQGVMRVGRQANTSIGRFVRLYLRNICGFRIPPGAGDKGSIASTFNVALAEDEDHARAIGWPTFAEEMGFEAGANVVTVQSVVCISPPVYSAGDSAEGHVRQFVDVIGQAFTYWSHAAMKIGFWHPLIVVGPAIAGVIAREWSKDRMRNYFRDNATTSAALMRHFCRQTSGMELDFNRLAGDGVLPAEYACANDADKTIKIVIKPEHIGIVVAGDPGRNQSRGYMGNHMHGARTSKRVDLPRDWDAKLRGVRQR